MTAPVSTSLDPNHPNYDAILLKRSRLEAHRRRREENRAALHDDARKSASRKSGKRRPQRRDD